MSYRYRSRRSTKRLARKSKQRFIVTLIIIIFLIYATLNWILPYFIGGVGVVKSIIKPSQTLTPQAAQNAALAPPILSIPFEATNSSQIYINGFGTPNSKVKLYLDGESLQTLDVANDGSFTFTNVNLKLGTNNIYGTTVDDQNKESLPSKTIKLFFDNEKPPLSISEPEDNKTIQGGDKKIKVSGKTDAGVNIYVNGTQVIVDRNGNFSTDQNINEGDNTISIKAVDTASNSTETERKVIFRP